MKTKHITRKATRHISQNEGLIFEKSSPGKAAWKLPPLDVPEVDTAELLGKAERKDLGNMPEVSEIEIIRHFTRLSTWNYAIDLGMRSEEHTSELQSLRHLVCRLLLEKKKRQTLYTGLYRSSWPAPRSYSRPDRL